MFSTILNNSIVIARNIADSSFKGIGPGSAGGPVDVGEVEGITEKVIGILQGVGVVVSIVMIIVLGINYFTASHKPDEKAKVDQRMQSIFLGTVLVLGATGIITFISEAIKKEFI